ncbi:hypothetical protein BGY98DRAFT_1051868 [Russula aff. rugulosa BPL654]|nr:hypothetical protein BGY98DRAFT_1051868 [Russula aff. rugulosa BPL654]
MQGPYEFDGHRMVCARLGLVDRVISQLYTFGKAVAASGFDEHIYSRQSTQLHDINYTTSPTVLVLSLQRTASTSSRTVQPKRYVFPPSPPLSDPSPSDA